MIDTAEADMLAALFVDALTEVDDPLAVLREWSIRHPELEPEFAAIVMERALGHIDSVDESRAIEDQEALMRQFAARYVSVDPAVDRAPAITSAPTDLMSASAARRIGYPAELSNRLRLPVPIVERIAARRIDPGTLPVVLVRLLSTILEAGRDDVVRWLTMPAPSTQVMAAMVREEPAEYHVATSFADLVENFGDFDDTDRTHWKSVLMFSRRLSEWE